MEYSAFEEATVPICSFVLKNGRKTQNSLCFRLSDFKGGMEVQKQKVLEALADKDCGYFYEIDQFNFSKVPGSPVAFWISEKLLSIFSEAKSLGFYGEPKVGLQTGDTNYFLRYWHEVTNDKIYFANSKKELCKWVPICKGGEYRRWYGNNEYIVNWENDGLEIKNFKDKNGKLKSRPQNIDFYFRKGITWNLISSSNFAVRCYPAGMIFDVSSNAFFCHDDLYLYIAAILNSKIMYMLSKVLNPTINFSAGVIANLPILIDEKSISKINVIVDNNIEIEKKDWNAYENSWDFKKYPLISCSVNKVSTAFEMWLKECDESFNQLKANEEELNRIFIDIYGLQDELTPEVEDKDVTVRKADLQRDIKGLISYAVGCMFGRYSLEIDGLTYAGGEWDNSKYVTFIPDADNCIPITDEEYFSDDIVGRFVEFVKKVYGSETLEENLEFIANALGNKGDTSRAVIRNYFVNDFYTDHLKVYQKRPIYWLFDSGKQNGFKALIYMHRYDADTVGRVRTDYLHKAQKYVETAMQSAQYTIDNATSASEKSKATKAVTKYTKQLAEMKIYDEAIAHVANQRIEIDLDDGVKVNYAKFQGVEVAQEGKKALKVDLLAKI